MLRLCQTVAISYFLTDVEKTAKVSFDPHEELETVKVSIDQLKDLVKSGEISHSIGVNAVFHLMMEIGIV